MLNEKDQIKYQLEYKIIPDIFFNNPKLFMVNLINLKTDYFNYLLHKLSINNPYERFLVGFRMVLDDDENVYYCVCLYYDKIDIVNIPLSYYTVLITDTNFENPKYFSVEKGMSIDPSKKDETFICGVDAEGKHLNYGTSEIKDADSKIMSIYLYGDNK